jgi:hypothetical protein
MSLCVLCGYPTRDPDDLCAHHSAGREDDWARSNRLMCDFLHRGITLPRPLDFGLDRLEAA